MAITRLSGGNTPPDGSDPRTFPAIWNDAVDDIEALELPITAARIADGAVTAPKLANTAGAVMVFDDATARTTAIPTPVEGMVTYLKDTDAVEKFDGDDFVNVDSGGLIAVKSALFTGTQVESSVASGANFAVTDLSITHEVADSAHRLIISAFFGQVADSNQRSTQGIAVHDGTSLIAVGASPGNRTAVTAGGHVVSTANNLIVSMPSVTFVHTPGAGSKTYTVRAVNIDTAAATVFINRPNRFDDGAFVPRGVSSLTIQEVAV